MVDRINLKVNLLIGSSYYLFGTQEPDKLPELRYIITSKLTENETDYKLLYQGLVNGIKPYVLTRILAPMPDKV